MDIPKQLSARPGDQFHDGELVKEIGRELDFFVDGEQIPCADVVRFDTEAGELERVKRNDAGEIVADGDDIPTVLLTGKVEVRWQEGSPYAEAE